MVVQLVYIGELGYLAIKGIKPNTENPLIGEIHICYNPITEDKTVPYRIDNNIDDHGWVFVTPFVTDDKCIQNGTLNEWCKKAGKMIGVPTLHDHDLRHSGSNLLKEAGMDIQDIAELLHHESTETTVKHYLTVNKKKVKENKDKFSF